MFRSIKFAIYEWFKPWLDKLAIEFKNELVRRQNAENAKIAAKLQEQLHARLTPELREKLQKQPPIGGCSHAKGAGPYADAVTEARGGNSMKSWRDFNIMMHTFADCTQEIRCMRCGEEAWNRHGAHTPNWDAFMEMTKSTTNHPTRSEISIAMLMKWGDTMVQF